MAVHFGSFTHCNTSAVESLGIVTIHFQKLIHEVPQKFICYKKAI